MMSSSPNLDLTTLPEYVRERWPVAEARAQRKVSEAKESAAARRLIRAAQRAGNVSQRVIWLHRAAAAWSESLSAVAACRQGCSHCCNTPVTITKVEAEFLAKASGRRSRVPLKPMTFRGLDHLEELIQAQAESIKDFAPSPCPFLTDGHCSVYEARPLACRTLLNLDDDDLLCRLVPGVEVPVPYAGAGEFKALYLLAQPNAELADIRDFFPKPAEGTT